MNKFAIKGTLSAAAVALSLGMVMNAKAEQVGETLVQGTAMPSETISFSRAELSTEASRAALEYRIREAAEQVCGSVSYRQAGNLGEYTKRKDCYDQAVSQAMSQIGADQIASTAN